MPQINRIRVNNVKYNFGTQAYDDFIMKPFGHNTLYDLANGGGKSVLMLLMLQNMIPNCTLDDKQPIEKLFRTGDGSQTIHSLIEWKLDRDDIENGFRYMTTGFCAKKAAQNVLEEEVKESASIEYFNYCIFYRDYNSNDIRNLPLEKEKEKITYSGLRRYLKELERDNSLMVYVFDKKREYQSFISHYGIYESEWEIIRGINKTEGHVRTYFESNYKTTRKVVEDLLIEEIIQKSFQLKSSEEDSEEMMSKTLLDIREKLMELTKRKKELNNYDQQAELLNAFADRTQNLKVLYEEKERIEESLINAYALANEAAALEKVSADKKQEEIAVLRGKVEDLTKKLEQGKVYVSMKEAEQVLNQVKEMQQVRNQAQAVYTEKTEDQNLRLCMNDYIEYQKEKQKRNEVMESIKAVSSNNTDLMEKISQYVFHIRKGMDTVCDKISRELGEIAERIEREEHLKKEFSEEELSLLKDHAVSQNLLLRANRERDELLKVIAAKNARVGILLVEEAEKARKEQTLKIDELRQAIEKTKVSYNEAESKKSRLEVEIATSELEEKQLAGRESRHKSLLAAFETEKKKAEKLLSVYGQKDYSSLAKEIHQRLKQCIQAIADYRLEYENIEQELDRLKRGEFALDDSMLEKVRDYIKSRYETPAMTGIEYLNSIDPQERGPLVHELPFLPYSIVLERGYDHLKDTLRLNAKEFENVVIPVLYRRDLAKTRHAMESARMMLISKDQSMLFDEKQLSLEKDRLANEMTDLKKRMERFEEQEKTFSEDEAYVHVFVTTHIRQAAEETKALTECTQRRDEVCADLAKQRNEHQELRRTMDLAAEQLEALNANLFECSKKDQILAELMAHNEELTEKNAEIEELTKAVANKKKQMDEIHEALIRLTKQLESGQSLLTQKKEKIHEYEMVWENRYKTYYTEGSYACPQGELSDWIETANGCLTVLESKYTDLDDKNRLMNSYIQAMNRCLKSIEARQIAVSVLEEYRAKEQLIETSEEELLGIKKSVREAEAALKQAVANEEAKKAEWNRQDGRAELAKSSYEERFGAYVADEITDIDLDAFSKDAIQLIKVHEASILTLNQACEEIFQQKDAYDTIAKDIERLLKSAGKEPQYSKAADHIAVYSPQELRASYEESDKAYAKLQKDLKQRCDEFRTNKQKTIDSLRLLNAVGLADEIQTSVQLPENANDTVQLMQNFIEVNECLMLEKDRILTQIADMQSIKDNFENQCLQRCIHIKTELERLPALSRITLDGEQIPIISLSIPYVKEEFYKDKMSVYIDEIVTGADSFTDQAERLKYIRTALSLKKLFSVIVTDMNAIRLSLYKRERIKEQSRHLRYEEAVGSTGQSQGIYIQFLIAIITYISNVNSRKIDNQGLSKVIFIDNPFGAAKDVYIWEPIFALLKANQVQLIVPARGTTPAITSRFDVNYILGQKLVNNRQQTVVVDYHSSIEAQETEFAPLKYEQASLQFFE